MADVITCDKCKRPGEVLTFRVGKTSYRIDLCDKHLAPLIAQARITVQHHRTEADRQLTARVRAYAISKGIPCPPNGRLPVAALEAWESSHGV